MSRAQRCHRGWRGCLVSRAAIGSPSGCPRDRRHCLRHATLERVDAVRRRVLFLLAPSRHAALASVFFLPLPLPPSRAAAALGLSLSRVRDLFFVRPLPSSLPSSRQNRRPYLSRPALAWASPLALYPTALARTPAFSSHRRASRLSFSLRCFATASRTPSLPPPCSRTPAFLPRRRPATRRPPRA